MKSASVVAILLAARVAAGAGPSASIVPLDRAALADRVRQEFVRSWRAYQRCAWGHDELLPVSQNPRDWYGKSLLMTPVDALDTMILLGLKVEADKTRALIVERLSFDKNISVKTFEVTIRLLGGLLSSYQLTGDRRLLRLASELGMRLLPSFNSPTGMPYRYVNLKTGKVSGSLSNPAEIGTLVLEFGTLSKLTKKPVYFERAKNALVQLYNRRSKIGLVGERIDVRTGRWAGSASHVSGGIDSYYEYLLKGSRLFGDAELERMWKESVRAINTHLADEAPTGLWYGQVDRVTGRRLSTEYGALDAFLPAVLAIGGDISRAQKLEDSCFKMWSLDGVEPEAFDYESMKVVDPRYALRPEIIESAYYLYHFTKDPRYLEMGKTFFQGLMKYCRTAEGYTVLKSVSTMEKGDLMPSYFLAETLKYLYLLFSPDDKADFDHVIFNTEAHPLRRTW